MLMKVIAGAVVALGVIATPLSAQRLVKLNLGGGVTLPVGDLADAADPGWHALGGLEISSFMQPIGIRVDGAYNRFGAEDPAADAVIYSATLNFSYRLPMTNSPLSPYVIAGWGAHWLDCSEDCEADQRYGWNAGLGTKFNFGLRGFLEARFHGVTGKVRYVPITLGLTL
jgi:hypothetical protein